MSGHGHLANISAAEQRKRLVAGLVGLALAVALLFGILAAGASPFWRFAAFPFFWIGAIGLLQAREKT
jgi:hypothetical protein